MRAAGGPVPGRPHNETQRANFPTSQAQGREPSRNGARPAWAHAPRAWWWSSSPQTRQNKRTLPNVRGDDLAKRPPAPLPPPRRQGSAPPERVPPMNISQDGSLCQPVAPISGIVDPRPPGPVPVHPPPARAVRRGRSTGAYSNTWGSGALAPGQGIRGRSVIGAHASVLQGQGVPYLGMGGSPRGPERPRPRGRGRGTTPRGAKITVPGPQGAGPGGTLRHEIGLKVFVAPAVVAGRAGAERGLFFRARPLLGDLLQDVQGGALSISA